MTWLAMAWPCMGAVYGCMARPPKRVVGCRGGSRYDEGCWGFPYLRIKQFLGFKVLKFQSLKVSKFQALKIQNFKVSTLLTQATGPLTQATGPPRSDAGVGIGMLRGNPLLSAI